ncbi:MAG: MmcQ/YjbR family DNA-binding protein [Pseudomonadota bacterium]
MNEKIQNDPNAERVRRLALSLPAAEERPHFDRSSFRVKNKIFATVGHPPGRCVVKLSTADREALLATHPDRFHDVGWAAQGWLGVSLEGLSDERLSDLLRTAWRQVAPATLVKAHPELEP